MFMLDIKNPSLYVFVGNVESQEVITEVMEMHPPNSANFLHILNENNIDSQIRGVKAKLQCINCGLDMQRANIYVVADACEPSGLVLEVGMRLRVLFAEDFAAFSITLVVLLDESNVCEGAEYTIRNQATYEFLTALTRYTAFSCIFLLSNRNEAGRVCETNRKNAYEVLAVLPVVLGNKSRFEATMEARAGEAGRVLFASAGVGGRQQHEGKVQGVLLDSLVHVLESELGFGESIRGGKPAFAVEISRPDDSVQVVDIVSVAAKPLQFATFIGVSVEHAEAMLFGVNVQKFYDRNFPALHTWQNDYTMTLRDAVTEEQQLRIELDCLQNEIDQASQQLADARSKKFGLICTVRGVKNAIADSYMHRYRLDCLQAAYIHAITRQKKLAEYLDYIRCVAIALKAMRVPPSEEKSTPAIINISLLRDDGLFYDTFALENENNPHTLRVVGGFVLEDLVRYNAMRGE